LAPPPALFNSIDTSIELDRFVEFRLSDMKDFQKQFDKNPFTDLILADLVTADIIRQHMATLFKFKANQPLLIDSNNEEELTVW
jgi:hypothetical protein